MPWNGLALARCFFLYSCSKMSASVSNTLSWRHLYLPWVSDVLQPDKMCAMVPLCCTMCTMGPPAYPICADSQKKGLCRILPSAERIYETV